MSAEPTSTHDESQIHQLIEAQARAISVKDVDAVMAPYAADAVIFDCKPPFQTRGADAWRRIWEECLPYFPASFGIERRDVRIIVNGDMAVATGSSASQGWQRIIRPCRPGYGPRPATNVSKDAGRLCMSTVPSPLTRRRPGPHSHSNPRALSSGEG